MTKINVTFKPLIWIFIVFFGLVTFFMIIEKETGREHRRALANIANLDHVGISKELEKLGYPYYTDFQ